MSDPVFEITLEDGRKILLEEQNETLAREAGRRWAHLNPADGGEIGIYEVTIGDRTVKVPAVSEEAAVEFTQAWGPQQRALEDARTRSASTPGQVRALTEGFTANVIRPLDAASAAIETGVNNLAGSIGIGDGAGYGMGDAFNAVRASEGERSDAFMQANPVQSLGLNVLGGLANPLSKVGGGFVGGSEAAGAGARGLLASQNLVPAAGRGLLAGMGTGAVAGLAGSTPGDELGDTARGGAIGAITGGAIPLASRAATAVTRATGLPALPAILNRATGGRISALNGDIDRRASRRIAEAMRADGLSQTQVRAAMNDWLQNGVSPTLLDIVGPNATRTRALIQGAAMRPGPGQTTATQYRNQVAGNLQDEAMDQAYRLTPDETRTATQYRQALSDTNDELADVNYAGLYEQPVPITDDVLRAIDRAGPQLRQASDASSFRFPNRAAEIDRLASGDVPETISAGALDRIQRRMGTASRNAVRSIENADRDMSADLLARQGSINNVLENVEGLGPARAVYSGFRNADEAVEAGQGALANNVRPSDYADELARLEDAIAQGREETGRVLPTARQAAAVGMRDQLVNQIGNVPEGATGLLNRLGTARNPGSVIESTVGPEAGGRFTGAMGQLRDRMNNARFIDPSTGSQTASRLGAESLVENIPMTKTGIIMSVLNKIRQGATMTDADLEAIVRLSTTLGRNIAPAAPRGVPVSGRLAPILAADLGG